jgi:hypothetical protein
MHPHRSMAIFILNKTSRLEPKSQKRVESAINEGKKGHLSFLATQVGRKTS